MRKKVTLKNKMKNKKNVGKKDNATALSSVSLLHKKIDTILKQQQSLLENQKLLITKESAIETEIETEEQKIEQIEQKEEKGESLVAKEMAQLQDLKNLEEQIEQQVKNNPLRTITYRDFTKGMIGAFVGIVAHFSFLEGMHVAENFDMIRATLLYFTSFFVGFVFLYFSGFRSVDDKNVLKFIPLRILVIYASALFVILLVLWLFGIITLQSHFTEIYKTVSAISILAILGACTADLIGKEH